MITAKSAGDAALLLDTHQGGNVAARLAVAIRAAAVPGVIDIVPGASTVLVTFEPGSPAAGTLAAELAALEPVPQAPGGTPPAGIATAGIATAEIDVVYDGPDLADVAALTRLSTAEVIRRHQAARYQVGWLGFSPGFGYLTGLDPVLAAVPRRDSPRLTVPAGSVAIAAGLAAVYPAASPGGWQLLGRTAAELWSPQADPPALLAPGMTVRFRAVDSLPGRRRTSRRPPAAWLSPAGEPSPAAERSPAAEPGRAPGGSPKYCSRGRSARFRIWAGRDSPISASRAAARPTPAACGGPTSWSEMRTARPAWRSLSAAWSSG